MHEKSILIKYIISTRSGRGTTGGISNNLQELILKEFQEYFFEGDRRAELHIWSTARLNIRNHLLAARVTARWHKLLGELGESPSLEIFQRCLGTVLGRLLGQGVGPDGPQSSLPASPRL